MASSQAIEVGPRACQAPPIIAIDSGPEAELVAFGEKNSSAVFRFQVTEHKLFASGNLNLTGVKLRILDGQRLAAEKSLSGLEPQIIEVRVPNANRARELRYVIQKEGAVLENGVVCL